MPELPGSDVGLARLRCMVATVEATNFSSAKLGRWLGRAQWRWWPPNSGLERRCHSRGHEGFNPAPRANRQYQAVVGNPLLILPK